MKINKSILLILLLASVIIFLSLYEPGNMLGIKYDIRVVNGFKNNSSLPLVIWCSYNEDDLGGRALQEGDDFSWTVTTTLLPGNTRCSCTMKWDSKRRKFEAFKAPRDVYRCGSFRKCYWLVKEDGFYFSDDEVNWQKDFAWF